MEITKKSVAELAKKIHRENNDLRYPSMVMSYGESYREALDDVFSAYTSLGCYPAMFYNNGYIDCAECSRKAFHDEPAHSALIIQSEVYWEGPAVTCDSCDKEIESAYGDMWENEE